VLYEMINWFDKYVKNAPARANQNRGELGARASCPQ